MRKPISLALVVLAALVLLVVPATVSVAATGPVFTASSPTPPTGGVAYTYTYAASGSPAPTFAVTMGALPAGLVLSSGGVLSGTPRYTGLFTFTIVATNASGTASTSSSFTVGGMSGGGTGPRRVAVGFDGTAYITDIWANTVTVFKNGAQVGTVIPVGQFPDGIAVSPDGNTVYVSNTNDNTVSVITGAAGGGATATSVVLAVQSKPRAVAVGPDGTAYVANSSSNSVTVIKNKAVVGTPILTGATPLGIAVSSNGTVYVANNAGGSVYVVTHASGGGATATASVIVVGTSPQGLAVAPDGTTVYVADSGTTAISVIRNNVLSSSISIGSPSYGLTISPDGATVYVGNLTTGSVSVIRGGVLSSTTYPGDGSPVGLALTPDGMSLYVANFSGQNISVLWFGIAPVFTASSPPSPALGVAYTYTFTASGAPAPTFAVTTGALPPGLTLSTSGVLSGTPTASGSSTFTIGATNTTTTRTITVTLTVPPISTGSSSSPPLRVAVGSDGTAYVVNAGNPSTVSVFKKGALVGTPIAVGNAGSESNYNNSADGVAVSPDGTTVYVTNSNERSVSVISGGAGGGATATVSLIQGFLYPVGVVVGADGTVYVANYGANMVSVVKNNVIVSSLTTGYPGSTGLAISSDGTLYVSNPGRSEVDYFTNASAGDGVAVFGAITGVGYRPLGLAVSPDGSTVYVTDGGWAYLSVIKNRLLQYPNLGIRDIATSVLFASNGTAYASIVNFGVQPIVNGVAGTILATGRGPQGIGLTPDGATMYVANTNDATVSTLDLRAAPVFTTSSPASGTVGLAYSYAFVASGAPTPTYTTAGTLPPGLTLGSTTGVLSGTPTTAGSYVFTVTATNGSGAATAPASTVVISAGASAFISSAVLSNVSFNASSTGTATGQLMLKVSSLAANQGWNVTVASSNFVGSGNAAGGTIYATGFQLLSAGAITMVSGQAINTGTDATPTGPQRALLSGTFGGALSTARSVIRAGSGYGVGSYTQPLNVSLTVPASSLVGLYTSTLTVTLATGP